jgi:predicted nuclease of predicted toxin-antitoxin system
MRLLFDENVHNKVVEHFADMYEVTKVSSVTKGAPDSKVAELAEELNAVLVTQDKDFGSILLLTASKVPGVILLRISSVIPEDSIAAIENALVQLGTVEGKLVVVEDNRIRVREISR